MLVIPRADIERLITRDTALAYVQQAFVRTATHPDIIQKQLVFSLPAGRGEVCIKTAYDPLLPTYTIKQVSVFPENKAKGMPALSGTMNVYNAATGTLLAVLDEQGWLTNTRTGCAGAIVDQLFRSKSAKTLGIIGTGAQAEFQRDWILDKDATYTSLVVWNRNSERARQYGAVSKKLFPRLTVEIATTVEKAMYAADTIVLATSADEPLITPAMVQPGKTIIAIGSDTPEKCEIAPLAYRQADKIFVDEAESALAIGGMHRALCEQVAISITGAIGEVLTGQKPGRTSDREAIIVNLVGLGIQDTHIANYIYEAYTSSSYS